LWSSGDVDARFLPRILFVSLTTLLTSPLRLYERLRYGRVVQNTRIHPSPIFIVGHWRTGTTHLHNLMVQDENLGFVSTFQGMAPGFCLAGEKVIRPLLDRWARRTHPTRIIDNMPLSLAAPQEEEFAVANASLLSFVHTFTLPRRASALFERSALFRGLPEEALARWINTYLWVLRKATFRFGGKRLVLKNPANTGRIPVLLQLFPDARFIHVVRNPYDVFLSTQWLYQTLLPRYQVQDFDDDWVDAHILSTYTALLQAFLADRHLIPPGNLVQVRFEDLEKEPLAELRRVYDRLGIAGFAAAEPAFQAYLASVDGYQKNGYELTDEAIVTVNRHWEFAFGAWGYELLGPSPIF
jgi:hypothetical protein